MSSWIVYQGLDETVGTIGQKGNDSETEAAADPQAHQKDGQDQREAVNRGSQHQREQPRPDDLGTESRHPREGNRRINRPGTGGALDHLVPGKRWLRLISSGERRQADRDYRHGDIQAESHERGDRHVEDAEQVEPGEQAAKDSARDIAPIEKSQPGDPTWTALDPSGDRRQRGTHQQGRWKQTDGGQDASNPDSLRPRSGVA
jgi:hypothetical protein